MVAKSGRLKGPLRLHPDDDVVVALEPTNGVTAGHKLAAHAISRGSPVRKLGLPIGVATAEIPAGAHVHTHNLAFAPGTEAVAVGTDLRTPPAGAEASFDGFVRPDRRVGTRNYIGVLTSVNCSATAARRVAAHFTPERLAPYPGVDGVVAFTHATGCGLAHDGAGLHNLRRTLAGYIRHPNFAGVLLMGLGCEVNGVGALLDQAGLEPSERLRVLTIQDEGGTREAIAAGIAAVEAMLPKAAAARRTAMPASHLTVGLQCGGSDGHSAISANPALGVAVDRLVAAGGAAILSETPELLGAESLLVRRAAGPAVVDALLERLAWWRDHAARDGADLNENPSPGNLAGGITTIVEKSLGAVAKGGSSPLVSVLAYAAPVTGAGLHLMDSPGYDPASATGQIAGGAQLIAFTTGRGSVFGSKPAPTLKLSSTTELARRMPDDIDLDCGRLLTGEATLERLGDEIWAALLAAASGRRTCSEEEGMGDLEFVPWTPGATF